MSTPPSALRAVTSIAYSRSFNMYLIFLRVFTTSRTEFIASGVPEGGKLADEK